MGEEAGRGVGSLRVSCPISVLIHKLGARSVLGRVGNYDLLSE
jgi:hypothetical protein